MKNIILAALALSCATSAFAYDAYLGVSAGIAEQKRSAEGRTVSDDDTAFKITSGYRYTPLVGAEIGYAQLGEARIGLDGDRLSAKPRAIYAAANFTYPVSDTVSIGAKLGVARTRTTVTEVFGGERNSSKMFNTSVLAGVSAAYAIRKTVSLVAEYEHFGKIIDERGATSKANLLSVGVRVAF